VDQKGRVVWVCRADDLARWPERGGLFRLLFSDQRALRNSRRPGSAAGGSAEDQCLIDVSY